MAIKNKKSNSIGKAQTRELSREKKKEKENDMEMMLLIYAASVIA